MEYSGIKIPKQIILVSKPELNYLGPGPQAYVVDPDNKNMLESAKSWAKSFDRETNSYIEGNIFTYENGSFTFELCNSAGGSSQGGKLSFWNCYITAPDGKKFIIGINADILINILKQNTFINGKCASQVYLGRVSGNVGAFTSNMPEYAQSLEDEKIRTLKKTSSYNIGDVLETLTSSQIYAGFMYERFKTAYEYWNKIFTITVYEKPKKQFIYLDYDSKGKELKEPGFWHTNIKNTKPAMIQTSEKVSLDKSGFEAYSDLVADQYVSRLQELEKNDSCATEEYKENKKRYYQYKAKEALIMYSAENKILTDDELLEFKEAVKKEYSNVKIVVERE